MDIRNLFINNIKNNVLISKIFGIFYKPAWEQIFIKAGLNKNIKVVFDVGANIGSVALSFIKYFPKATIWAFEPCDETFKIFEKNTIRFKDRIKSFKLGLYNDNTNKLFNVTSFHPSNSLTTLDKDSKYLFKNIKVLKKQKISVVKLDDFVNEHKIEYIDLIKIDVEGVELELLDGGKDTFKNKVDVAIIEISFVYKSRNSDYQIKIFDFFYKNGFYLYDVIGVSRERIGNRLIISSMDCVFKKYSKMNYI